MSQENPPPYTAQPAYNYNSGPSYPPPPPGYAYPPQGHTIVHPTVVPTMVPVVVGQRMGAEPSSLTCKSCNMIITTRTERRITLRAHLSAALLCILGCWPCICLPYCLDSCNNIDHYCPNCNSYIGAYIN